MELMRHAVAQCCAHYDPTFQLILMANAVASYYSLALVAVVLVWWRDQGSLPPPTRPVRQAVNDHGLFTAGWFGVRKNTVLTYNP